MLNLLVYPLGLHIDLTVCSPSLHFAYVVSDSRGLMCVSVSVRATSVAVSSAR